jgi:hypothetical protein
MHVDQLQNTGYLNFNALALGLNAIDGEVCAIFLYSLLGISPGSTLACIGFKRVYARF